MGNRDLPPHDVWVSSQQSVERAEQQVAKQLKKAFVPKNKTVYMSIGNHESPLPNAFPTTNVPDTNITDLYEMASDWKIACVELKI
jgi:hypothetical protein